MVKKKKVNLEFSTQGNFFKSENKINHLKKAERITQRYIYFAEQEIESIEFESGNNVQTNE